MEDSLNAGEEQGCCVTPADIKPNREAAEKEFFVTFKIPIADLKAATQAFVQRNWADNAVSFTVNISKDVTRAHLAEAVQHFLPQLKGTTVFPDVSRPQSPYERIDKTTYDMAAGAEAGQAIDQCVNGACPVR